MSIGETQREGERDGKSTPVFGNPFSFGISPLVVESSTSSPLSNDAAEKQNSIHSLGVANGLLDSFGGKLPVKMCGEKPSAMPFDHALMVFVSGI